MARLRWLSVAVLASAGLLTLAAHVTRLWAGCAWGDYSSRTCLLLSAQPASAIASLLQSLGTAALAAGLVLLPRALGRDEGRHRVAAAALGVLGLVAAAGVLPLAWFLAFPVLVFVALGNHGTSWLLVLGSPLAQVLLLPGALGWVHAYDALPWGQLVTGLCLLLAAYAARPDHGRSRAEGLQTTARLAHQIGRSPAPGAGDLPSGAGAGTG